MGAPDGSMTVPSIDPLGRSCCANPPFPPVNAITMDRKRNTRELRRFPSPPEARNFNKRSLLPTPGHAGTATWNRSPQEWLLPLYKVELTILLNKAGMCAKPQAATSSSTILEKRSPPSLRVSVRKGRSRCPIFACSMRKGGIPRCSRLGIFAKSDKEKKGDRLPGPRKSPAMSAEQSART
jgi:hypothetical protein